MKRLLKFFIVCTVLFTTVLKAQQYNIPWEGVKMFSTSSGNEVALLYFDSPNFGVDGNNIPLWSYNEPTNSTNLKISIINPRWVDVSKEQIGAVDIANIPKSFIYDARIVNSKLGKRELIEISLLINENGSVKRLESFEVRKEQLNSRLTPDVLDILDDAPQSVLREGDWYKIAISQSGIYRLDYEFFNSNGISTNFNPQNIKIYGNGGGMLSEIPADFRYGALQQNAIQVVGGDDGSFDNGDYILFYAQGPHTWTRGNNLLNTKHNFNIYDEKAYYFIGINTSGAAKRIQDQNITGTPTTTFSTFHQFQFIEKDSINIYKVGRQWMQEDYSLEPSKTYNFQVDDYSNTEQAYLKYRLIGASADGHTYEVSLNGTQLGNGTFSDFKFNEKEFSFAVSGLTASNTVQISVDNSANPSANVYLDYLELKYLQNLQFANKTLIFQRLENLENGNLYQFNIGNASAIDFVWDISDITTAKNLVNLGSGSNFTFNYQSTATDFQNQFVAFSLPNALTPDYIGRVINQNIRSIDDVEYVVITHPSLKFQAERLANFRNQNDGYQTAVVTIEEVYNEFSSGNQDITAIRDFLKHLRDKGSPLRFAVMFGAGSYDYKDRIDNNFNLVPAYQSPSSYDYGDSYVTDDYYTILDDTDNGLNTSQMDIAVGRIHAVNNEEATLLVDKILAYEESLNGAATSFGDWRTKIALSVDDDDPNRNFLNTVEPTMAQYLENTYPYLTIRKLYSDAFEIESTPAGVRYPSVNQAIKNSVESGALMLFYFGHGGPRGWAQERIFTIEDAANLNNYNSVFSRFPLLTTITCEFTLWDVPSIESGGVIVLKNPSGGSAAAITTSREVFVFYGEQFTSVLINNIFDLDSDNRFVTLGEGLTNAKIQYVLVQQDNWAVNLIGDPAMRLYHPPRPVSLTSINGEDPNTYSDPLRALDFVTIEGEVLNVSGSARDTSFNGTATLNLFDKAVNKQTRNNPGDIGIYEYQEQINSIYRGNTSITNGQFKFEFYVPKDINYNIGNGKIVIYVHNGEVDGVYAKTDILVGGQNPDGIEDNQGPAIGLYMNNLNFVDGGITDRNPYFLACVTDDTGINATGIGVGHDITGVLDDNVEGTIVFNDFYEGGDVTPCNNPNFADYQKGRVWYRLTDLDLGEHTIKFKVWDINNNSTTASLDFIVLDEGSNQLEINKLLNWPNPFTDKTYFQFEHNCDSELEVMVQVFTVSGKLIKTIRTVISEREHGWAEGYRTGRFAIPWDGTDDFGDKIGRGTYIYKVSVRGTDESVCKGLATDVEKLVILK